MAIINGETLFNIAPIKDMVKTKLPSPGGVTYGLGEAGYDIRIKESILFEPQYGDSKQPVVSEIEPTTGNILRITEGRFILASAIEKFNMPSCLCAEVKDKSTWARNGLSVFNTVIENGWVGYLTLELVFHGNQKLLIPAGAAIAQVLFYQTSDDRFYSGRYQDQQNIPVSPKYLSEKT